MSSGLRKSIKGGFRLMNSNSKQPQFGSKTRGYTRLNLGLNVNETTLALVTWVTTYIS